MSFTKIVLIDDSTYTLQIDKKVFVETLSKSKNGRQVRVGDNEFINSNDIVKFEDVKEVKPVVPVDKNDKK